MRQAASEGAQNALSDFDLFLELFARTRGQVIVRNLPAVLEVAVEDEPVGTLAVKKKFKK